MRAGVGQIRILPASVWASAIPCCYPGEAATVAFPAIYDALKDPQKERVVVVAHSQGTLIAAVVLRLMEFIYRPGEICQWDLWETSRPVPVGDGQDRRACDLNRGLQPERMGC